MSANIPQSVKGNEIKGQDWLCRLAGLSSGLLLVIPTIYPALVPIQLIALTPLFYLAAGAKIRSRGMLVAGLYMGLAYTLPQLFILRLPVPMSVLLLGWLTIIMVVIAWACGKLLKDSGVLGAVATGALLVVADWVNFTALPIWGTAQSLVRPWSQYPALIQFVSLTGITGIIFALGSLQALAVRFVISPQLRLKSLVVIITILLVLLAANVVILLQKPIGQLKVAAVGWTSKDSEKLGEIYSEHGFEALLAAPIASAAENGARLIVCPEGTLWFSETQRQDWLDKLSAITRKHNIFLAIGYIDTTKNENRMMFISPLGDCIGEYTKTHLVFFENFNKGDDRPTQIEIDGYPVGAMICQDDNFIRLSRQYGRRSISLVAVPTWDWLQVKDAHLQNSIHRAIESRYAIVRAVLNGISAIVSPDGSILARKDHFREGPGIIAAELPLYSGHTLFSRLGHWPVVPCVVLLSAYIGFRFKAASTKPRLPDV
jgi:apolipoprotein N-acyltransferase